MTAPKTPHTAPHPALTKSVSMDLSKHPIEARLALHRTLRKMRDGIEGQPATLTTVQFRLIETPQKFGKLLDKVRTMPLQMPSTVKLSAKGDFLKWLFTALWTNREAILAFIKEIIGFLPHMTEQDFVHLLPMLVDVTDAELVELFDSELPDTETEE